VTGKHRTMSLPSPGELVRTFNLTLTEAEVTLGLVAGQSTADIAVRRGTSVHTVRTHLKRALVKTGTHSRAALVGKVLRGD
jgi:DNA-binding CsgD family transcriptional regulator